MNINLDDELDALEGTEKIVVEKRKRPSRLAQMRKQRQCGNAGMNAKIQNMTNNVKSEEDMAQLMQKLNSMGVNSNMVNKMVKQSGMGGMTTEDILKQINK